MRLIGLAVVLALSLVLALLAADAQQAANIPRIGFLSQGSLSDSRTSRNFGAFRQGLRELGYGEGQNIAIEARWAEGKYDRLPGFAAELVRLKVNVIVAYGVGTQAAQQATRTIPIVMTAFPDPVAAGFVASLARPGGNITGSSSMAPELVGKQLELLKEAVPGISRVALLANPANPGSAEAVRRAQEAARELGVRLQPLEARGPNEIDGAFAAMTREQVGAGIILVDSLLLDQRTRIGDLAIRDRLPTVSWPVDYADHGHTFGGEHGIVSPVKTLVAAPSSASGKGDRLETEARVDEIRSRPAGVVVWQLLHRDSSDPRVSVATVSRDALRVHRNAPGCDQVKDAPCCVVRVPDCCVSEIFATRVCSRVH